MYKFRVNISAGTRIKAVEDVIHNRKSAYRVSKELGVACPMIKRWVIAYKNFGPQTFEPKYHTKHYSIEIKQKAVEAYLSGSYSMLEIVDKFKLSNDFLLRSWIDLYNSDKLFNPKRGKITMKQGRKTTKVERLEIVKYALTHKLDYQGTSEKYQVSYNQVYSWVHKYKTQGNNGFEDCRGKSLAEKPNKTEQEAAKVEVQKKDVELEYLRAEVGFLKKLRRSKGGEIKRNNL